MSQYFYDSITIVAAGAVLLFVPFLPVKFVAGFFLAGMIAESK
jgi:hypothetical protein